MPIPRSATGSTARSPAAAWVPYSRATTPISAATSPSRCSARTSATIPTWSAGSSRRRRSAAATIPVGHVRHFVARNEVHRLGDFQREGEHFDTLVRVGRERDEPRENAGVGKRLLAREVIHFDQGDRRNGDFARLCGGGQRRIRGRRES